jgi:uncharacterized membrane protein (GlpM family)
MSSIQKYFSYIIATYTFLKSMQLLMEELEFITTIYKQGYTIFNDRVFR